MATAQQQPMVFDAKEAERFAALWAGFDTGNASEAEAMGKGRVMRRMAAERNLRIVDALELPEIRQALDDQMQPARMPVPDVAALRAENEDLQEKLARVVPEVTRLADALTRETELTAQLTASLQGQPQRNGGNGGSLLCGVMALALAVECVVAVIGLIGGHETSRRPAPAPATAVMEQTKPATKPDNRTQARPETQPPLPLASSVF